MCLRTVETTFSLFAQAHLCSLLIDRAARRYPEVPTVFSIGTKRPTEALMVDTLARHLEIRLLWDQRKLLLPI